MAWRKFEEKGKNKIASWKNEDTVIYIYDDTETKFRGYEVSILDIRERHYSKNWVSLEIESKRFVNDMDAINYAKAWMKEHPKG